MKENEKDVYKALEEKIILVTGAGGGIGKAIVRDLIHRAKILISSSRTNDVYSILGDQSIPDNYKHIPADLTQEKEVIRVFDEIQEKYGKIDIVINTIGGSLYSHPIEEFPIEEFDEIIRVNLRSAFLITREAFKAMKKGENGYGGNILHFVSSSAKEISHNKAPYGTAKAGLAHFIHYAAVEGAKNGILVNGISPTFVFTERHIESLKKKAQLSGNSLEELYERAMHTQLIKKPLYPEYILPVVRLLVTTRVITGQIYNVSMGEILNY